MTVETILSRGQPTGFFVDPVTGADQKDINWFVYGNSGPCYSADASDPMGNPIPQGGSCAYSQKVEQKCPNPEDAWNDASLSRFEQKLYNSIADFTFDTCPPLDPFDIAFHRDKPYGLRSRAQYSLPTSQVDSVDPKLPNEMLFSAPPQWSGSDGARQQYRIKTYCQGQITAQVAGNMNVPFSIDVNLIPSFNGFTYPGFLPQGTTFVDFDGTLMGTVSADYDPNPLFSASLQFTIDNDFLQTLNVSNCSDSSQSDGPGCIWYTALMFLWVSLITSQVLLDSQHDRKDNQCCSFYHPFLAFRWSWRTLRKYFGRWNCPWNICHRYLQQNDVSCKPFFESSARGRYLGHISQDNRHPQLRLLFNTAQDCQRWPLPRGLCCICANPRP
jgi:hypothetical protein